MRIVLFCRKTYVVEPGVNAPKDAVELSSLSLTELCSLYNLVMSNVSGKRIKGFKDKPIGIARVAKALIAWEEQPEETAEADPEPAEAELEVVTATKGKVTTSARARVINRLTRRMCSTLTKVKAPEKNHLLKFWGNYSDDLTIRDVIETEGLDPAQVCHWLNIGCMKATPVTDEAYATAVEKFNAGS